MYKRVACLISILSAVFLCAAPASGSWIYRCEEPGGQVTFSDKACVTEDTRAGQTRYQQETAPVVKSIVVDPGVYGNDRSLKPGRPGAGKPRGGARNKRVGADRCHGKVTRLSRVNDELRHGYEPARGEKLKRQRRELEDYIRTFCR